MIEFSGYLLSPLVAHKGPRSQENVGHVMGRGSARYKTKLPMQRIILQTTRCMDPSKGMAAGAILDSQVVGFCVCICHLAKCH